MKKRVLRYELFYKISKNTTFLIAIIPKKKQYPNYSYSKI